MKLLAAVALLALASGCDIGPTPERKFEMDSDACLDMAAAVEPHVVNPTPERLKYAAGYTFGVCMISKGHTPGGKEFTATYGLR